MNYINILSESIIWVYHLHCFCCSFAQLQNTRLPCPSLSPRVCSNSCPLNQWCHPTISSSVIPFSSCLQSSASGSFPVSQFFTSCGQSIGVSVSAAVLPMNKYSGLIFFRMDWLGLLAVQRTLNTTIQRPSNVVVSIKWDKRSMKLFIRSYLCVLQMWALLLHFSTLFMSVQLWPEKGASTFG